MLIKKAVSGPRKSFAQQLVPHPLLDPVDGILMSRFLLLPLCFLAAPVSTRESTRMASFRYTYNRDAAPLTSRDRFSRDDDMRGPTYGGGIRSTFSPVNIPYFNEQEMGTEAELECKYSQPSRFPDDLRSLQVDRSIIFFF